MEWLAALAVLTITGTMGMAARAFRHSQGPLRREARQRAVATSLLARRADSPVPTAETHLVAALASSVPGVALAAARGLAQAGTARAVPPLREAERQRGDLRSQARQSIAAIQSRLTGATPGQVSLTGGGAGRVSVVDSTDGRVTMGTDEPSR